MKKLSDINKLRIENNIRVQCLEIKASSFLGGNVPELFLSSCYQPDLKDKNKGSSSSNCKKLTPEILKKLQSLDVVTFFSHKELKDANKRRKQSSSGYQ